MMRLNALKYASGFWSKRSIHQPPSYFNDPLSVPRPYKSFNEQRSSSSTGQESQSSSDDIPPPNLRSVKDFALVFASLSLAYMAIDNYKSRIKIEKVSQETAAINIKTLQLQQQSFAGAIKKQELRFLNERMSMSKRCFKMALHIAMLRQQLTELGVEPKTIDELTAEFEKSVKMSNSGPGTVLWLDDESRYKPNLPDYREYDRKGK